MTAAGLSFTSRRPGARRAPPARAPRHGTSAPSSLLLDGFFVFGFLYLTGIFTRLLASGEIQDTSGQGLDAPLISVIGFAIYLAALAFIMLRPLRWVGAALPLAAAACGLALASALWSVDPGLCLRRGAALSGSVLFAYLFCTAYSPRDRLRVLRWFSYLFVAVNLVAVAIPGYGVHTGGEGVYAEHAGRWRGVFFHKNSLAQPAAVCLLALLTPLPALRPRLRERILGWGMLAGCAALVVFAASAQIFIALPLALLAYGFYVIANRVRTRVIFFLFTVAITLLLFFAGPFDAFIAWTSELLGRDPTLSNRTLIWGLVLEAGQRYWVLGHGYGTTWTAGVGALVKEVIRSDPGHPHNGFLLLWLDLGVVGIVIVGALIVQVMLSTLTRVRAPAARHWGAFSFGYVFLFLTVNLAGSDLLAYNSLYWTTFLIVGFNGADAVVIRGRRLLARPSMPARSRAGA